MFRKRPALPTLLLLLAVSSYAQPRVRETPRVDSVAHDAIKVVWRTFGAATSMIVYGRNEALTDTVLSGVSTADHAVTVTGLSPGVIYRLKAVSTDNTGTLELSPIYGITSTPASTGEVQVYFNLPIDASLSIPGTAKGNTDLGLKLLERISQASHSIDLALYSFSDYTSSAPDIAGRVADSLVAARNRGVSVRMVYDDRSFTVPVNTLIGAGIPVVQRNVSGGIMHNKFWIFDARDSTSATDDWLVTGSWNLTDGGTYLEAQNAVFVQDRSLALIYTKEFEEMFGSATDVPNTGAALFGPYKSNNTPAWTMVGGTRFDVRFSPSDGTTAAINSALFTADENIFFALLVFTRDDLASIILSRSSSGAVVRGLIDDVNVQGSEYDPLRNGGLDVLAAQRPGATGFVLHHKYGIVDPFNDASDPLVITGSHNWSTAAETDNDENTLIIHSGEIARQYVREFSQRYAESGGTAAIVHVGEGSSNVPVAYRLSDPWPNPFNPTTSVLLDLPTRVPVRLSVNDILGRDVALLADGSYGPGRFTFSWEPSGAGGTYFVVLSTPDARVVRRVLYLR